MLIKNNLFTCSNTGFLHMAKVFFILVCAEEVHLFLSMQTNRSLSFILAIMELF